MSTRLNYDHVATSYDNQPYRAKAADPFLLSLAVERPAVLDLACGTGSQTIANATARPDGRYVGVDFSAGMLARARRKAPHLHWLRGDASALPFVAACFDFVSFQFALHHVARKQVALREVARMLRPGGRFVYRNLLPEATGDWVFYRYFPAARDRDARDFLPLAEIQQALEHAGATVVKVEIEHIDDDIALADFLGDAQRRDVCSQTASISTGDFAAGVARVEADIAAGVERVRSELALVTLVAERR